MRKAISRSSLLVGVVMIALLTLGASSSGARQAKLMGYTVTPLVSDQKGAAPNRDKDLVNAWGLSASSTSPWWSANNGTDTSTLYQGDGTKVPLTVKVGGAPTGTVFNGTTDFTVKHAGASGPSVFLFSTESGTILGWNPNVPPPPTSTKAFVIKDRSNVDAEYKGLAIASTAQGNFLYATDFHNGRVDVFNGKMQRVHSKGMFVDPAIPNTYAPFGIQNIGGNIFVSYAKVGPTGDDLAGHGHGFVDEYDAMGNLMGRVATRGALDSPWGLAMAPADFEPASGALLVGNFGNGKVNAFRMSGGSWNYAGKLRMANGDAVKIDGLWALGFGNGAASGPTNSLYFTAGPDDESHGLFGTITADG
jgi:uncharacterized protein (TIGR03118 family)